MHAATIIHEVNLHIAALFAMIMVLTCMRAVGAGFEMRMYVFACNVANSIYGIVTENIGNEWQEEK